ncbi:MAG: TolC family protein [Rhodothermales bacterium]|nr:TolC family protein [Rhodothermales bacterium]MBO6781349.1 TolC family protein [Rhodothermales bacterium]
MNRLPLPPLLIALVTVAMTLLPHPAQAQTDGPVTLTMDEAIQIARVNNNVIRNLQLEEENASALVNEGWAQLFPQVSLSSSYTRNVRSANPFSGSSAGSFFQSLGFIDWLAFNEQARTDGSAETQPISVEEFFLRQQAGLEAAGIVRDNSDNPFAVPTQYANSLSITQKIFDPRAVLGAAGASRWLKPLNSAALERQEQVVVNDVKAAFLGALLAQEQTRVMDLSVRRSRATTSEVARQVAEGVAPKFQRLSAEVNLANLETQLTQTSTAAASAIDNLKLLLGIPGTQEVRLRGSLDGERAASALLIARDAAINEALTRRPDLEQARIAVELEDIQLKVAKSAYLPTLDAFLNVGYIGNVPDSRVITVSDPNDPFSFSTQELGYFSDAYWDTSVNVGLRLSWTLFDGLGTHRRVQQRRIAKQKAEVDHEFLQRAVAVEVDQALRNLRTARQRLASQEKNVERAELNYSFAETRLREGVASPLEVREASDQLDQSRLNYLQAIHDFLVAESAFEAAVGAPEGLTDPSLTSNQ